jgi:hypothetical protein
MAETAKMYGQVSLKAFTGLVNLSNDTIKVMLCTSGYTPDQDNHILVTDVNNEVAGTGYTTGGATLANKTINYDVSTNTVKFDADDVAWANSTITAARYAIIYDSTTGILLGYVDFGVDKSTTNITFNIEWDSAGIFGVVAS